MVFGTRIPAVSLTLALLASVLWTTGCDTGTTKNEAQYQALQGTWEIVNLEIAGVSFTTETRARYDSLQVTFRSTAGGKTYTLHGEKDAQNTLIASGSVTILDAPQSLALTRGPETVILTYDITQSRRAMLAVPRGRLNGSNVFLQLLLPNGAWSGSPSAELRLERL